MGFVQVYQQCPSRPHETYLFLNYLGKENLLFLHGKAAKEMRLRCGSVAAPLTAIQPSSAAWTAPIKIEIETPLSDSSPIFAGAGEDARGPDTPCTLRSSGRQHALSCRLSLQQLCHRTFGVVLRTDRYGKLIIIIIIIVAHRQVRQTDYYYYYYYCCAPTATAN